MNRSLFYLLLLCAILPIFIIAKNDTEMEEEYPDDYYEEVPSSVSLLSYLNKRVNDTFEYKYSISDRTTHEVKGTIKDVNGTKLIILKGEYQWELEKGLILVVEYEADENGFRVTKTRTTVDKRIINSKSIASLLG